jgi:YD repeat-containing protein
MRLIRKTGETWVVSGSTVNTQTFTYDAADNRTVAQDANGTYTMAYDALNRMISEQDPFRQVFYDAAGNRTQVTAGPACTPVGSRTVAYHLGSRRTKA